MKTNGITLYQFRDFDIEKYISLYRESISEKDITEYQPFIPMADFRYEHGQIDEQEWQKQKAKEAEMSKGEIVHQKAKLGVLKATDKIVDKCAYLQDAIIRRATSRKGTMTFSLSSKILKSVVGHEYKRMLEVFIQMGYITLGSDYATDAVTKYYYYSYGKYSTLYTLTNEDFITITSTNRAIIEYKEKTKQEYEKMKQLAVDEVTSRYGQSFTENYITSLRKIHIEDEESFNSFCEKRIKENPNAEYYYRYLYSALNDKNKSINKIDASGRIYTCLTNLDRELKQYLNIDFMLDCRNSHPLLFNYFIFNYYNISPFIAYKTTICLKSLFIPNTSLHNVGKILNNQLKDNNLDFCRFADDELYYIYLTSRGELWDDIAAKHPEMTRSEVKVRMFQEVFYSNTPYAYHWKEYAVEFKKQFPSVYKLIGEWKKARQTQSVKAYMDEHHLFTAKPTSSLSLAMMNLEAQIFTEILKRLYKKRWNAVHIHDCIVIPKDGNKNHPTQEQVMEIMEEVYKEYGLSPSFG